MDTLSTHPESVAVETRERLQEIRSRLPGQVIHLRTETARMSYGPLYSRAAVEQRVAESLPPRLGFSRRAWLDPIETYREPIPDEALLKYDDAVRSGLFSQFLVATPTYRQERQVDPWIVARVSEADLYAIIAHWV